MIRVVVDTNVLVSGLISPEGFPAKIIDFWQERKYILVTSKAILQEMERVLNYPRISRKYQIGKEIIADYLRGFSVFAEVCRPTKRVFIIRNDPHDNKFIEAAVNGKADLIVSGDHHLLDLKEYQGIKIFTAKEFLEELKKEQKKKEPGD